MCEPFIHLGLHKTASTYLQKVFFPLHAEECGYIQLREQAKSFLRYILYTNDFEFDPCTALHILKTEIGDLDSTRKMTISDEQFCGSPWDNAKDRQRYFDRLNGIFPEAKYIVVFRNHYEMIESLYLQYIKTGGSATLRQFLSHKSHPLEFSNGAYLNYDAYIEYIVARSGKENLLLLLYEDMIAKKREFLEDLAQYIGVKVNLGIFDPSREKPNPSLNQKMVPFVRFINTFSSSQRQPFLILPSRIRNSLVRYLITLYPKEKTESSQPLIADFCNSQGYTNLHLMNHFGARAKDYRY